MASSSVPANIVEWLARTTNKDFAHFVSISHGSLNEAITFLVLAEKLAYTTKAESWKLVQDFEELASMLSVFRKTLSQNS